MTSQTQTTTQALELLKSLQGLHNELRTLDELLEAKPRELREAEARLERQQQTSASLEEDAKRLQLDISKCEHEIREAEAKIGKFQTQQNAVKNNREYKALQDEIDNVKVEISRTEDKMLGHMTRFDESTDQQSAAARNLDEERKRLEEKAEAIRDEIAEIQGERDEIQAQCDEIMAQVEPKFLEPFMRLSKISGGVALCAVKGQICSGCFINLTAQTVNALMGAHELIYCLSCGRILYLE